jgi:hypothetical protein
LSVRPCLECLEERAAAAGLSTSLAITGINQHYTLFNQVETLTAQVNGPSGALTTGGQVTFTDGGQTQTVPLQSNGTAQTTFTFGLFAEIPSAHSVTASFNDPTGTFAGSTTSATANQTVGAYLFQLELYILASRFVTGG